MNVQGMEETHKLETVDVLLLSPEPISHLLPKLEEDLEKYMPECLCHPEKILDLDSSENRIEKRVVFWAPKPEIAGDPEDMMRTIIAEFIREQGQPKIWGCEINGRVCGDEHRTRPFWLTHEQVKREDF